MHFTTLLIPFASLYCGALAASQRRFVATFDDLKGSRVLEGSNPVPTPYEGLAYDGFYVFDTTAGLTNVPPANPPNFATSRNYNQMRAGQTSAITINGTTTKSFDLLTTYNACQNIHVGDSAYRETDCTIEYTGVKTNGAVVKKSCMFVAAGYSNHRSGTLCVLPKEFTALQSVSLQLTAVSGWFPFGAVAIIDNVVGNLFF